MHAAACYAFVYLLGDDGVQWFLDIERRSETSHISSNLFGHLPRCGKTATNVANSPRGIYEGVIISQNPSNWFKLNNDGTNGLTNAISSQAVMTLTNGGGAWDVDAFGIGNGAFSFTNASNCLTVGDVISGGTSNNQGSMSLLFRSIEGYSSNTVRYVFCQGANNSEFSAFFEPTNTANGYPGSLKVKIAGQTLPILQSNELMFGVWYYLAFAWDETRDTAPEVAWYVGRIGGALNSGTIDLDTNSVVGSNTTVYLGNRDSVNRAFRGPGFGALDQIAFWNRELTNSEVNAQFNALSPLFQGPAKAFDLTRWNLLLPVDKTNGLNTNNLALEISTGWLNSGFKYVDPADWTQKYFFLSTSNTMVFEAPWNGARSSTNGGPRSELRGTLANGNEHNWKPGDDGGTHILDASCTVNTAGNGKVIIGQIHAKNYSAVPFVTLAFDNRQSPPLLRLTVKHNPQPPQGQENAQVTHDFTSVPLGEPITYQLKFVGSSNTASLYVTVNGVTQLYDLMASPFLGDPNNGRPHWTTTSNYFKAGCYYPDNQTGITAKVTFSNLQLSSQP